MYGYSDYERYFDESPTLDDEIREQVQEVFHFRSVERLPSEGSYE